MHTTPSKRWMEVEDFERLYPKDITKYEDHLSNE
jgi:hypothetical protein